MPKIIEDRLDMHAYICGLDKMVRANRELLKSLGWDRKQILYEKYDQRNPCYRPPMNPSAASTRRSRRVDLMSVFTQDFFCFGSTENDSM